VSIEYAVLYRDAWIDPMDTEDQARDEAIRGYGIALSRPDPDQPFRTIDGNREVHEQLAKWRATG
jgi:hypothetical protein